MLALTELPQKGGHSSGSFGGSVSVSSQYATPIYGSGSSGGFGGYQSSQQAAQGFGLKGQSGYNTGNYRIGGYTNKGGYSSSGGGGGYNVGSNSNGFSHGGNGNGFGQRGSFGHSTAVDGGLQSLYAASGFGSSSHLGSINLKLFPDSTSSLITMSPLVSGVPNFANSNPMIGHFGQGSSLFHNSGLDLGTLTKLGSLPIQISGIKHQGLPELHSLPSTKYGLPSTNLPSSKYSLTPSIPSANYDASSFGLTSLYGVPSNWPSIKIYGGSPGEQSSMYGPSLIAHTSTLGGTSRIPSIKYSKPSLDLTTLGGFPSLYSVPSTTHGTTSGVTATNGKSSLSFGAPSGGLSTLSNSLFSTHGSAPHGALSAQSTSHAAQWTPLSGPSPSYGALSGYQTSLAFHQKD